MGLVDSTAPLSGHQQGRILKSAKLDLSLADDELLGLARHRGRERFHEAYILGHFEMRDAGLSKLANLVLVGRFARL